MNYLAVLGRQPELSLAELEALFSNVQQFSKELAFFDLPANAPDSTTPIINRLGGCLKLAQLLPEKPLHYLRNLPAGKITLGISDYSKGATTNTTSLEALKLKKILTRHGRSVRVVLGKSATLPTATSLHNGLSGKSPCKVELIKVNQNWYRVIGVQDIDAYSRRDQARPARDAKVGMLPPKLAQILINLCGPLPSGATILDPFCGTGVVLQEALLMGYHAYGTDLSERMAEYSQKNLDWLTSPDFRPPRSHHSSPHSDPKSPDHRPSAHTGSNPSKSHQSSARLDSPSFKPQHSPVQASSDSTLPKSTQNPTHSNSSTNYPNYKVSQGDATAYQWIPPIDAVACEGYLGRPMSSIPTDIVLKTQKQECASIILRFLKNLAPQIQSGTPVVIAAPAWLRPDGTYSRLDFIPSPPPTPTESTASSPTITPKSSHNSSTAEPIQTHETLSPESSTDTSLNPHDNHTTSPTPPEKVDEISKLGYNVNNKSCEGLLYHRKGQIVARDIIILRKK